MTDREIDLVYEVIDDAFTKGEFHWVNRLLGEVCESAPDDIDAYLTYLTATSPAKSKLPNRGRLYILAHDRFGNQPGLLDGLE